MTLKAADDYDIAEYWAKRARDDEAAVYQKQDFGPELK